MSWSKKKTKTTLLGGNLTIPAEEEGEVPGVEVEVVENRGIRLPKACSSSGSSSGT